jgi:hypothetical protein
MKFGLPILAVTVALSAPLAAQDHAAKPSMQRKPEGKTVTMVGCIHQDARSNAYSISGAKGFAAHEPLSSYEVELSTYVGKKVEVSAVLTDPDNATEKPKTNAGPQGTYTVVSVKPAAGSCAKS